MHCSEQLRRENLILTCLALSEQRREGGGAILTCFAAEQVSEWCGAGGEKDSEIEVLSSAKERRLSYERW